MRKKKRNILLIEPNYKNKYPPIGLMKISTYHKKLKDNVRFFKGDLKNFILDIICSDAIKKLNNIEESGWEQNNLIIKNYIKRKNIEDLNIITRNSISNRPLVVECLKYFSNFYRKKEYLNSIKWDRIYITTLFTFHWKITIETINFMKNFVRDQNDLWVGGVLASILQEEVKNETGILTYKGLLDRPGILDDNDIIIDELPLDYSLLDEIDYKYPANNAYYGYTTRGCVRKCKFCVVWKMEPQYKDIIHLKDNIKHTKKMFGEQKNLLLLDNNVLASDKFPDIIAEIKKHGFIKGAKFQDPDYLKISIRNLKRGINDVAYKKKSYELLENLLKKAQGDDKINLYKLLEENHLLSSTSITKENLINSYEAIAPIYEKYRNKGKKLRYVDFNQGVDARFITKEKMALLSEIPIKPLRIAFDSMKYEKPYVRAVKWAAKFQIRELSNYLLYNFNDPPIDLYKRLALNVKLANDYDIPIYSFPMKYLPIDKEEYYKNRNYIGKYWNRKFLRAIQVILNSTKGKIGRSESFFLKAFGKDEESYFELLYMPEIYLLYRYFFESNGYIKKWRNLFQNELTISERTEAIKIIETNDFTDIKVKTENKRIRKLLNHYDKKIAKKIHDFDSPLFKAKKVFEESGKKQKAVAKYKTNI